MGRKMGSLSMKRIDIINMFENEEFMQILERDGGVRWKVYLKEKQKEIWSKDLQMRIFGEFLRNRKKPTNNQKTKRYRVNWVRSNRIDCHKDNIDKL